MRTPRSNLTTLAGSGLALAVLLVLAPGRGISEFEITRIDRTPDGTVRLTFPVHPDSYYVLREDPNLDGKDRPIRMSLPDLAATEGSFAVPVAKENPQDFFRVERVPRSEPKDSDGDGIDDLFELQNAGYLDPLDGSDAGSDPDADGLSTLLEVALRGDPQRAQAPDAAAATTPSYFGSALLTPGSSAMLTVDLANRQFHWVSSHPAGTDTGGFVATQQWVLTAGTSPAKIVFEATVGAVNFYAEVLLDGYWRAQVDVVKAAERYRYLLRPLDLDVDSDNTTSLAAPDRDAAEDQIEDDASKPGLVFCVNEGDIDVDGIPDFADGFNLDGASGTPEERRDDVNVRNDFAPVVLELPPTVNLANVQVKFTYNASDPGGITLAANSPPPNEIYLPAPGNLRLWNKSGRQPRNKDSVAADGNFIPSGVFLDAARLGFVGATRTVTLHLEAVRPNTTFGDQRILVDVISTAAGNASIGSDAVRVTAVRVNLTAANVTEAAESLRGAVVCLNNDNDDFGANNFDPDRTQNSVPGENDLQPLILSADLAGLTTGEVRVDLDSDGADRVKVWGAPTKGGAPFLDNANRVKRFTVAQFNALPKTYHVEGFNRTETIKGANLRVSYSLKSTNPNLPPNEALCQDAISYTVVELLLDVDRDNALTNDNPQFQPGYTLPGDPAIASPNGQQLLKLAASPLTDKVLTTARFTLSQTSAFPGIAMNLDDASGPDFSLDAGSETLLQRDITAFGSDRAVSDLYCRDFGGRTTAHVTIMRGNVTLATCELRIPLDADRDTLPDFWETALRQDPNRANAVRFDPRKPDTLGGVPGNDAAYDDETQPDPAAAGAPALGILGDGLIAFEEYRGFFYGADNNTNHRHHRTSPHSKDVFAHSNLVDIDGVTPLHLGYLPAAAPQVLVHRINNMEWLNAATREVNYNRAGIPAATLQRAIQITADPDNHLAAGNFGVTSGGIDTGANGVCESQVAVPMPTDLQLIPRNRGLANTVALRGGANGIIDPPFDRANDKLNAGTHRIEEGGDGRLHTVVDGYAPQEDDRVRATIQGGANGLDPATVTNKAGDDVLRGSIAGNAGDPLDPATVASASGDELAGVRLDPNGDGIDAPVAATDTLNGDGTVSPLNPNNGMEDGFQTPGGGNDFFRGMIGEGGNNRLDATPAGNDIVMGSIQEGADSNLQSRPRGDDIVTGFIEAGPNGRLDPHRNNFGGNIVGSVPVTAAAVDDGFNPLMDQVTTGPDGIRNTNPQPGSDDVQVITMPGQGQPNALCVDANNGDGMDQGTDDTVETAAGGDDLLMPGANMDPNNTIASYIHVQNHNVNFMNAIVIANTPNPPGANIISYAPVLPLAVPPVPSGNFNCMGGANQANRLQLISQTIAHEAGHYIDVVHWNLVDNGAAPAPAPAGNRLLRATLDNGTAVAGHTLSGSNMTNQVVSPVPNTYDTVDRAQFRLHRKH